MISDAVLDHLAPPDGSPEVTLPRDTLLALVAELRARRGDPRYVAQPAMIECASGAVLDFARPEPALIRARDVARGIATRYRYAGHTPGGLYTVAEHSIIVSFCVPEAHARRALVHDGAEGYGVDMPSPIKNLPELDGYRALEDGVQRACLEAFGVDPDDAAGNAIVLDADRRLCADEVGQIGGPFLRERVRHLAGFGHALLCLEPGDAERAWLNRFRELFPRRYWR